MTDFVLVHSPLVGPATWAGVAEVLVASGHGAVVPSLAATSAPPFTAAAVQAVVEGIAEAGLAGPFVVAGHSGAGPLLPAVGAALGGRVSCTLFVDAALPVPGRSRLSELHPSFRGHLAELTGADRLLPPWHEWWGPDALPDLVPDEERRSHVVAELTPIPYGLFEEVLPVVPGWPAAPCGYLRLSDAYRSEEAAASGMGWPVSRLAGTHLELVNRPDRVASAMVDLLRRALDR